MLHRGFKKTLTILLSAALITGTIPAMVFGEETAETQVPALTQTEETEAAEEPVSSDDDTDVPEDAETPDDTDVPEDTETPDDTDVPEDTETPDDADAPEDTETPDDTDAPDSTDKDLTEENGSAALLEDTTDSADVVDVTNLITDNNNKAAEEFAKAMKDLAEEGFDYESFLTNISRLGGITQAASGCLSILEMLGIVEDPTQVALHQILDEVQKIEDKLSDMSQDLNKLTEKLEQMAAKEEERARQQYARDLLSYWRTFNTQYLEPLKTRFTEYNSKIKEEINDWWLEENHEGVRILYTSYKDEITLTYSNKDYSAGFPDTADNGETILKNESLGLPSDYIPATASISFDINTYQDTFEAMLADSLITAANEKKLEASDDFYKNWAGLDDAGKKALAEKYAPDFMNTIIYHISCKAMRKDNIWVADLIEEYKNYCTNINLQDSGINALINVQYMTHGFEGEIKDEIIRICDSMIASAGYYGIFALNCAGQDSLITLTEKQDLQKVWADTIQLLSDKKGTALTGYDNYCYVIGALVSFQELNVQCSMVSVYTQHDYQDTDRAYKSFTSTPWKITDSNGKETSLPAYLKGDYSLVLYDQYLCQKADDDQTYLNYLHANGTGISENYKDMLMTEYQGVRVFSLSDALFMYNARQYGNYFSNSGANIFDGKNSKATASDFVLHDKVVYDCMDPSTGEFLANQVCAARAAYMEYHWYWNTDEGHVFYIGGYAGTDSETVWIDNWCPKKLLQTTNKINFPAPMNVLALTKVPPSSFAEDSPHAAYKYCYIVSFKESEGEEKPYSEADWSNADIRNLLLYEEDDDKLDEGINAEIDMALERAEQEGISVSLTDTERTALVSELEAMIFQLQFELETSSSTQHMDVFGIDGSDEELQLAAAVLPDGYLDDDGQSEIPKENIKVMARYEPGAFLKFEMVNGTAKAVIDPAFNIDPLLVVWDSTLEEFEAFEISDEVMTSLGLTMTVQIPAASVGDQDTVRILHYQDVWNQELIEEKTASIQGSGNDRYVSITVSTCSPFVLKEASSPTVTPTPTPSPTPTTSPSNGNRNGSSSKTAVKTGDENNMTLWLLLFGIAAAAAALTWYKKRQKTF